MIKKLFFLITYIIISKNIFAQTSNTGNAENMQIVILLILVIAVAALVMSIVNYFRISHNQKVTRAYLSNLSDDVATTISKYNSTFEKEIRFLKREKNKKTQNIKNEVKKNKPLSKNKDELKENSHEKEISENKQAGKQTKRRSYRRRNIKQKQQSDTHNQSQEKRQNNADSQ